MLKEYVLQKLNQVLGDYFENIDPSQLQLSLFGGDVSLYDLKLKKSIFSELGVPFELLAGRCGTLNIKIPWTGLLSQPLEVVLRDVFLLVVPKPTDNYDPEKEEERSLKKKLKIVEKIEASASSNADDSVKPEKTGYFARMAMSILGNIRIQIESIHIRYEDHEQECKIGVGLLLSNLSILTTDSEWNVKFKSEHDNFVHKVVNIEGLGLYWNSYTSHFSGLNETDMLQKLKETMKSDVQATLDFMIGPIRTTTKVAFIISPDKGPEPFSTPRAVFKTVVDEIPLGLNRNQFLNIIRIAESLDFMLRKQKHRKFRPNVSYKDHYRDWWKFAYECTLEEIERKRSAFRWSRIKQSGQDARDYETLLRKKNTTNNKLTPDQEEELKALESRLTIFNIVRIRKLVDIRKTRTSAKASYWFVPYWFSSSEVPDENSVLQELTPEEKSALEKMLRTKEPTFPKDYVTLKSEFVMENLKVTLRSTSSPIMVLSISHLQTRYSHTEVSNIFSGELNSVSATGSANNKIISKLEHDTEAESTNLLDFEFAMNGNIYNLIFRGESLEVIYDFLTVQNLISCFHIQQNVSILMIQAKALEKYRDLKELSKKNIKNNLKESLLTIDFILKAPRFLFPEGGSLIPSKKLDLLIVNLGSLKMKSVLSLSAKQLNPIDKYEIELTGFQIIFQGYDVNEKSELLKSDPIAVDVEQCTADDVDAPKLKINVKFPSISFIIREPRLLRVFHLIVRLPIPPLQFSDDNVKYDNFDLDNEEIDSYMFRNSSSSTSQFVQSSEKKKLIAQKTVVQLEVTFDAIRLFIKTASGSKVLLKLQEISVILDLKTFGTSFDVTLFKVLLKATLSDDDAVVTLMKTNYDDHIVKFHFFSVSPEFPNKAVIKDHITLKVGDVDINVVKEVLDEMTAFVRKFLESVEASSEPRAPKKYIENSKLMKEARLKKQPPPVLQETEVILKIEAALTRLTINLKSRGRDFLGLNLLGFNCSWVQKVDTLDLFLKLSSLSMNNLERRCFYKKILKMDSDKVVFAHITQYFRPDNQIPGRVDLRIKLETGSPHVVILASTLNNLAMFCENFHGKDFKGAQPQIDTTAAELTSKTLLVAITIDINAPKLIVPEADSSPEVIVMDCGKLTLKNSFKTINEATVEEIEATVGNVAVTRQILDLEQKPISSISLVAPIEFSAKCRRNHSNKAVKSIPDYFFNGNVPSVSCELSSEDYRCLVGAITSKLAAVESARERRMSVQRPDSVEGLFALEKLEEINAKIGKQYHIVFKLTLRNLGLNLYKGSSYMQGKVGPVSRVTIDSLATLLVDQISAEFNQQQESAYGQLALHNVSFRDMRSHSPNAEHDVISAEDAAQETRPMLTITYKNNLKENTFGVKIVSLEAVLQLEYIFEIVRFFRTGKTK